MVGGLDDLATLGDRVCKIHAQPQALDHRSEMPGVDDATVDGGLPAHGIEPGAVEKGRLQWMAHKSLIETGNGSGGVSDVRGEVAGRWQGQVRGSEHACGVHIKTII
jgi:hypothetical protein